jgi:hypothetical protein
MAIKVSNCTVSGAGSDGFRAVGRNVDFNNCHVSDAGGIAFNILEISPEALKFILDRATASGASTNTEISKIVDDGKRDGIIPKAADVATICDFVISFFSG